MVAVDLFFVEDEVAMCQGDAFATNAGKRITRLLQESGRTCNF
jgi:hypothetical protein